MKFYLDTSVFGGLFDKEFEEHTSMLFDYIDQKKIKVICSEVLEEELERAPDRVRLTLEKLRDVEYVKTSQDAVNLAAMYVREGALTEKGINDAQHIAIATVARANVIVSWNFKHMVNFLKIRQYNAINLREGYGIISIYTPVDIVSID